MISTKHKVGHISELKATEYFISQDYRVSKPIMDYYEYDLIVDKNNTLSKVQVKTAYWDVAKKRYLVSCVTSHIRGNSNRYSKKYKLTSFDILCVVEPTNNAIYLIPIECVAGRRSLTFYVEGKPKTVTNRYSDFEEYRVL